MVSRNRNGQSFGEEIADAIRRANEGKDAPPEFFAPKRNKEFDDMDGQASIEDLMASSRRFNPSNPHQLKGTSL